MIEQEISVPASISPYLNEISERLWTNRAAVMIGAGFSKNAGSGFPNWNQLGDIFYQKAHGVSPEPNHTQYTNVLRLAEEVQASIGRPALENLLRSNIPDLNTQPSKLHVDLLELPWVDVFTTNYDTLLERAGAKVVTRRYEPVVNKEDIPYAAKPRIVKLHGSFPSERPFIITEEDYRRYPHDYAPFVNTVQQALLENTFCLIGFSGDDPNFLQWIGWIRDNLGKDKTQKIYLIGLFDLSPARLQLLSQRGIIVVDLSFFNGVGKGDHERALRLFVEYIQTKKPDALDWPSNPKTMHPAHDADRVEEVKKVTQEWRHYRLSYPGWLILPHNNRQKLWSYTEGWVDYIPDLENSSYGVDILYAFELIWRIEKCLLPLFGNLARFCEKLLKKYRPRQDENNDLSWGGFREAWLAIALAMLRFYREEGDLKNWKKLERQLRTLSHHFSPDQEEFLNYESFLFSMFSLDLPSAKQKLESWRPNQTQPYWMAKRAAALAEIGQLNNTVEQIHFSLVESRKQSNNERSLPDYQYISRESYQMLLLRYVKRASETAIEKVATSEEEQLIKELCNKDLNEKDLSIAKKEEFFDSKATKSPKSFSSTEEDCNDLIINQDRKLEKEALLRRVRQNQINSEIQQQNTRWDELKSFRCDPWNEIKLFELTLKNPAAERKRLTRRREFDIGRITQTHHFGGEQEVLGAYSFLRFCEDVGLPYRIANYTMEKKTALTSLQLISRFSSFWAIATLARLGDHQTVDSLFSRESVYNFKVDEADQLIHTYLDAIKSCRNDIYEPDALSNVSYCARLAQLLPEIISRLCSKCSAKAKNSVLDFVIRVYGASDKSNYKNIRNLLKRLIGSMSETEQYKSVPTLLKIPFPGNLNLILKDDFLNPFLFLEINKKPESAPALKIQAEQIKNLIQQAKLDKSDRRRRWAITSLVKLHSLDFLDSEQSKSFASALWGMTDEFGMPDNTDFYKFTFLKLPYPKGVDPVKTFKRYVASLPFPIQKNEQGEGVAITGGHAPIIQEIIGANSIDKSIWTTGDASDILNRLLKWWDADKNRLLQEEGNNSTFFSISEEFLARFSRMSELLTEIVGPRILIESPDEIKASLVRLLMELHEFGVPSLAARAACLHILPDQAENLYSLINDALISNQENIRNDGLTAIRKIISVNNDKRDDLTDAASMLSQYLTWCPTRHITFALWVVFRILKDTPSGILDNLEMTIHRRLNRLLVETVYDTDSSDMSFDEKLEVRRVASILSAALWRYYNLRSLPVPEIIEEWREKCLSSDEFAEIRNPWRT